MHTTLTNIPCVNLRLSPEMIERRLNVHPFEIIVDVPLMFDCLPDEVQKIILQALAADASVEGKDIQQETITVFAGVSCRIRHHARHTPGSHAVFAMVEDEDDEACLTAYGMTAHEAGGEPVSAILDPAAIGLSRNLCKRTSCCKKEVKRGGEQ